ncbi:g1881 [Coccomyxa elongata]
MGVLEGLHFDNLALRTLPVDTKDGNERRPIPRACYARVKPTSVKNPRLVAASPSALALLDLDMSETDRKEFVEVMSGNMLLPGMDPAAHCYCGHQFGNFAGQLGDGAVIYLGEVINSAGARWEIQLKGAGLTPFSRQADGRKVLRSSIREFLASEALHHLGIATTRAGCITTSDTEVVRDVLYNGNPISERASLVLRIAPTFFRFGSFEIFKKPDTQTGRAGPSYDESRETEKEMLPVMLNHIIKTYFPDIWEDIPVHTDQSVGLRIKAEDRRRNMYLEFYFEVVRRTFQLVAAWQSVGFCHGVLNTDNMSILGLTIDYGPYGFLDRYDPEHVCNHSDDSGMYSYEAQPGRCFWNCEKLAEALAPLLDAGRARAQLDALYAQEYHRTYQRIMRQKLGLLELVDEENDAALVEDLLEVMHKTGADFTNTFRWLAMVELPPTSSHSSGSHPNGEASASPQAEDRASNGTSTSGSGEGAFLERILSSLATPQELAEAAQPRMHPHSLRVLLQFSHNDLLLASMGVTKDMLQQESARLQRSEELKRLDLAAKARADAEAWRGWLRRYRARLQQEVDAGADACRRIATMNGINPRYVLRNWIAQQAIDAAEKGDYNQVHRVLRLLENPYSDDAAVNLDANIGSNGKDVCKREMQYDGPVPQWAKGLCVSCSS